MIEYYLFSVLSLFLQGSFGMFYPQYHLIISLLSLELMLLSISINFVVFSILIDDLAGQIYALFILAIAAAETAIGLAILVSFYRLRGGISIELISIIKS